MQPKLQAAGEPERHSRLPGRLPALPLQLKPGASDAHLLAALHPTPAVCGRPREDALGFLAASEPFDRGFYAGPFGWVSQGAAEFVVAIRSALVRHSSTQAGLEGSAAAAAAAAAGQLAERLASHAAAGPGPLSGPAAAAGWAAPAAARAALEQPAGLSGGGGSGTLVSLFAGVGIVRGSDTASEWAELDLKVRQYERLLQGVPPLAAAPNVNALWARLLVEELCRLGCNTFCVAPGEPARGGLGRCWLGAAHCVPRLLLKVAPADDTFAKHLRKLCFQEAPPRPCPGRCRLALVAADGGSGAAPARPHRALHW